MLTALVGLHSVNILEVLREVAILTAPPVGYGFTTAETWAWRRYLPALDPGPELRLRNEWSSLDPHQKTILSDDWGVGLPIHLLRQALQIRTIASTHYVLNRLAPRFPVIQAHLQRTGKRGPSKSPDFLAIDSANAIHIIECKGNQSDVDTLKSQLIQGIAQKKNIVFSNIQEGERLVAGLFIPQYSSAEKPLVMIRDPQGPPLKIEADFETVLREVIRGELASTLHASRLPTLGNIVALNQQRDTAGVKRELESLSLRDDQGRTRYVHRQEFSWALKRDDRTESHRLELEIGIAKDVIDALMNPRFDLLKLLRQQEPATIESDGTGFVAESALGFYFSARLAEQL